MGQFQFLRGNGVMKKLWIFYIALCAVGWVHADTTIDPSHPYDYVART